MYIINSFILPQEIRNIEVAIIPIEEIFLIFLINFTYINIILLTSFVGFSFILTSSFVWNMSSVGIESGISPNVYYLSSLSHGVLELIIYFLIFSFTVELFKIYYKTHEIKDVIHLTKAFYKKYYFSITLLAVTAAFAEVIVSNRLINYIVSNFL